MKRVIHKLAGGAIDYIEETFYIRDASGNIMSTYTLKNQDFTWNEAHIYGSSRLGVIEQNVLLHDANGPVSGTLYANEIEFLRGKKRYAVSAETKCRRKLSNHLGNVLAVVSDKRTQICVAGNTHYEAEIIVANDYYPFGMQMPDRSYAAATKGYRFGFNGKEQDDEIAGSGNAYDFGARIYDSRLGRWLGTDPLQKKYPSMSPYSFVANSPLIFVDPDGEKIRYAKGLSRSEKRQYKSHIKVLRKGSPTFNKIYRDLRKSKEVYTYDKTDKRNDDHYDRETNTIYVNFEGNDEEIPIMYVVAHETGHAWRDENNLDIEESDSPYPDETSVEAVVFKFKANLSTEFEGTHIENIIRSEMGDELREEYGKLSDLNAGYKVKVGETEYPDFSKRKKVAIRKDSNYDYTDDTQNHYENLKERKHSASEIDVYKYEDPKKYK